MISNQLGEVHIDDALTKVVQDKVLPFEPLIPNATTIEAMAEANTNKLPRFFSVNDLMASLHAAN
jgi:DNA-damage-inducible protein J